jgi:penicillin-binding protein 2
MPRFSSSDFRLFFLAILMLLGLAAIIARLWVVQVVKAETYASRVGTSSKITVRIPSVRGEIRDRNGIPLVQNRASYNVDFYLPDMVRGYRERTGTLPKLTEQQPIRGMLKNVEINDVVKIVNTGVIPRLQELDLARDYNANRLKVHYKNNTLVPYTYIEDIDFPTIAKFSENDVGLPGVDIAIKPVREYVYGAFAAHILGYVGMPKNIDTQPDVKKFNFYQTDVEGKSQIEFTMDKYLRGEPGMRILQRNAKGSLEGQIKEVPPKPGNNVYLTIDARIQYITEVALRNSSLGRAAAVVLDPNNGDILAIASVPSFDPNIFIPSISSKDWNTLLKDPAVPLISRAVGGFPPASTFKLVTALAGFNKGLGSKTYDCPGYIEYGGRRFHCWIAQKNGTHGVLDLADAMKVSCDSYFYQYANAAGIDSLVRIATIMGIGRKYDHLGLSDEREGSMPGPEWLAARNTGQKWTSAYTANTSIGQGYVLASPLQMAVAYASVANGGIAYEPRLIRTVLTPEGQPVLDENGKIAVPDEPIVYNDLRSEFTPDQIENIRKGLWEVVNESGGRGGGGTGSKGRVPGVVVAGKTGTAQATDRGNYENIAWFCSFAPYDKPRYVFSIMVQGGLHGGGVAAPIASHILKQILEMEKGTLKVDIKPLAPASHPNPFLPIESLSPYSDSEKVSTGNEEPSDLARGEPAEKIQLGQTEDKPDIKPDADEQGRVSKKTTSARAEKPKPATQNPPRPVRARDAEPNRNFFQRFFNPRGR